MRPQELVGRRVRIWLGIGYRGEPRRGREKDRYVEGVVEVHSVYGFVIPAEDGRVPYVVDETRVLDLWTDNGSSWVPIFNGRKHKRP